MISIEVVLQVNFQLGSIDFYTWFIWTSTVIICLFVGCDGGWVVSDVVVRTFGDVIYQKKNLKALFIFILEKKRY